MLDWLIIGGGVHGTHLSHALVTRLHARRDRVAVLDPHPRPLHRWRECTRAIGMRTLRSPSVHHIGLDPFALRAYAKDRPQALSPPYDRPSLEVFDEFCDAVIAEHQLDGLRTRGEARAIHRCSGGFRVETDQGELRSARVVLAMGQGDQRRWTAWALQLAAFGGRVHHVFDPGFHPGLLPSGPVIVVGGGISAAHLSLTLARRGHPVALWMRHPLRIHQFDAEPGWIGPKFMADFRATQSMEGRRALIRGARHRGSMPLDLAEALGDAIRREQVRLVGGELVRAAPAGELLLLETTAGVTGGASLVLCTGFEDRKAAWLDQAIEALNLRCASCGGPLVDRQLQWSPGLFVMGPLAELELGPTARNITGARAAAERIAGTLRAGG